jgi:hypothetical protein
MMFNENNQKVLVLKTDIQNRRIVKLVKPILNKHPMINVWSIDTHDIDNVLRIEASGSLVESDIINLLKTQGFLCEELPD